VSVCVCTQRPTEYNFNLAMMVSRWSVEVVPDANGYERLLAVYSSYNPDSKNSGHDVIATLLQQQAIARGAASTKLLTNMGNHYHNTQVRCS
jgi:hypothetical protein